MRLAKCCGAPWQEGIAVSISMHSSSETAAATELLIWRGIILKEALDLFSCSKKDDGYSNNFVGNLGREMMGSLLLEDSLAQNTTEQTRPSTYKPQIRPKHVHISASH